LDSDGGKTGTTARIRSSGLISNSPFGDKIDAKYSKTCSQEWKKTLSTGFLLTKNQNHKNLFIDFFLYK